MMLSNIINNNIFQIISLLEVISLVYNIRKAVINTQVTNLICSFSNFNKMFVSDIDKYFVATKNHHFSI